MSAPEAGRAARGAHGQDRALGRIVTRVRALLVWWQTTRAARANARFGAAGGGVLTGGIAYAALFSAFAALTIAYTVFMAVLGRDPALRDRVLRSVSATLPGLIDTGSGTGLVKPGELVLSAGLNVAGIVAVVVLVMSATSALAALRTAVRAMFDVRGSDGNVVTGTLRELAGLAGMAGAVLVSAVLGIAVTAAAGWMLRLVGLGGGAGVVTSVLGVLIAFVVDAATFVLVVRVLAHVHPAWPDLCQGALIAAVGVGIVRLLGTSVVAGSARHNAVLASFAVIVTLLVWINLIARIVLLAAAWTADPPATSTTSATTDQTDVTARG
jgi:membrane protein